MAITVDSAPGPVQPVYQPFFFQVQSSNYTQPQFRFIFDVYKNGSFVERVKMPSKPGTNIAIFSPARILENYLSYDIYNFSNDASQDNCVAQYQVQFGEEYGAVTAPPVVYANLNSRSGYTFNGTVQYMDYYQSIGGSTWTPYYLKMYSSYPNNGKFLTTAPTATTISTTDYGTISCFNFTVSDVSDIFVERATMIRYTTYQYSGGSVDTIMYYAANSGTAIDYKILHFPAGPYNINTIPFAQLVTGKWPVINSETDYAYDITLFSSTGPVLNVAISETRYFEFEDCSKYENVRLQFLNRLGAWDYYNFRLVSRDFISTEKSTFKKNLPINYYYGLEVGNREKTVGNSTNIKTKKVTSNWITDDESAWLEELLTSPEVYEIYTDTSGNKHFLPVVVRTASQEIKKRINDQIFNYEIEYEYASEVNTQRN